MIYKGLRYCDRCGKQLTRNNNKCGYELCDTCNEWLENKVNIDKEDKIMTMLVTFRSQMNPVKVKNVMKYDFIIEGDKHYLAIDCPDRAWYFDNADIISIYIEDKEVI